ncbi:MAG: S-layer homology domain-containing protein [Firmicutes bacterium]|nr:S-layer homology domain-containing protein [Bacillota bacterium]
MNKFTKNVGRSGIALILTICLVFGLCATGLVAQTQANASIIDVNGDGKINYVSIGESMTNGYGLDGYYPSYDNTDPAYTYPLPYETMDKLGRENIGGTNTFGYERHIEGTYPQLFAQYLKEQSGKEVVWNQLAISGMRPEDFLFLFGEDKTYTGDKYTTKIWETGEGEGNYSRIVWGTWGRWYNQGGMGSAAEELEKAKADYMEKVKNADIISINLGTHCFSSVVSTRLLSILNDSGDQFYDERSTCAYLLKEYPEYQAYYNEILEKISAELTLKSSPEVAEKAEKMLDVICYATLSFMITYEADLEIIEAVNPDAQIIQFGMSNFMEGLGMEMEDGSVIDLGSIFGILFDFTNVYRAQLRPDYIYIAPVEDMDLLVDSFARGEANDTYLSKMMASFSWPWDLEVDEMAVILNDNYGVGTWFDADPRIKYNEMQGLALKYVKADDEGKTEILNSCRNIETKLNGRDLKESLDLVANTYENLRVIAGTEIYEYDAAVEVLNNNLNMNMKTAKEKLVFDPASLTEAEKIAIHVWIRSFMAEGIGCHPSELGHKQVADAMIAAYEYGYISKDALIDTAIEATKIAIGLMIEFGPEIYDEFMAYLETEEGQADIEKVKQALLELKAYLETEYPEESAAVYEAIAQIEEVIKYIEENPEEVEAALEALYLDATTGEYVRCNDHYYVALGGYTTDDGYFAKAVAENYGIEYKNLGDKKLTFEGMEDYIAKNAKEIAKASFITYNMDASYFAQYMLGFETQKWDRYMSDENIAIVKETKEKVLRVMRRHMDTETIEALIPTVENMCYAAVAYGVETVKAVEAIQEINADATLVVTGMYNPLQGVKVVLKEETVDLGEIFDYIIEATDLYYLGYAIVDGNVTFVDICDTDVKGFGDVTIKDLDDTKELAKIFYKAESKMHASKDGHAYIAEQIIGAIDWNDAHTFVIGQIDEDPLHEEYCIVCGAEREAWTDCPFTDIDGHWAYNYIRYAYENNLMNGKEANLFVPQEPATRAQIITMLYRMETGEFFAPYEFKGTNNFTDLKAGEWYSDAMFWALDNGILKGYEDNTCRPNAFISRQEMACLMQRYAAAAGIDVSASANIAGYDDATAVADWAKEAMSWCVAAGLIQGNDDNTLRPAANTLRSEVAAIFYRYIENNF